MLTLIKPYGRRWRWISVLGLASCLLAVAVVAGMLAIAAQFSLSAITARLPLPPWTGVTTPLQHRWPSYRNYTSAASFDCDKIAAPEWMAAYPDSVNLTTLSIPGTHDTMTFDLVTDIVHQCQNHDLQTQLRAGIRYLDIRAKVTYDDILIWHASVFTGYSFTDVLETVFAFLKAHPSEAIIMRLKEEGPPINSTMDFETAFNYFRLEKADTAPGFAEHLWMPAAPGMDVMPDLGMLRGKFVILQEFGAAPAAYGFGWTTPVLSIEDDWIMQNYTTLARKLHYLAENLEAAKKGAAIHNGQGNGVLYLSHTSASVGLLPIQAATGTGNWTPDYGDPDDKVILGMNDLTSILFDAELADPGPKNVGVIIMDFPGKEMIQQILDIGRLYLGKG